MSLINLTILVNLPAFTYHGTCAIFFPVNNNWVDYFEVSGVQYLI